MWKYHVGYRKLLRGGGIDVMKEFDLSHHCFVNGVNTVYMSRPLTYMFICGTYSYEVNIKPGANVYEGTLVPLNSLAFPFSNPSKTRIDAVYPKIDPSTEKQILYFFGNHEFVIISDLSKMQS